ncbi:MAG: type I glyceraldehyde-3-phosphate dehydrogenase [Acidobacteriota bacterium]|nr:type I glyceraldehyde-3-phosphate dehydrogenase [Acidobacteriota bacterium]
MTLRIGINGFGRIGRSVTRLLLNNPDFELVGINDLTSPEQLAHALKYDSIFAPVKDVRVEGSDMLIGPWKARVTAHRDPADLPWTDLGVDYVLESTGQFRKRAQLEKHLTAGAEKVFLSVPAKEPIDATVVMGVNHDILTGNEKLLSNASCTTNAAAPVTKVIQDAFGIDRGFINTIHAYTNDQRLIDTPHKDWRRSRAAAMSIIPTTTGAAKAVGKVIPALDGKLDGMAYRVPVPNGSIVDMIFEVSREVTVEEVNAALREAAEGSLKGILEYQADPIVSKDIIGNSHSSIFDSLVTQVLSGRMVKVASWYDNEWGYSARMVDLMKEVAAVSRK